MEVQKTYAEMNNEIRLEDAGKVAKALRNDATSINEGEDKRGILSSRAAMYIANMLDALVAYRIAADGAMAGLRATLAEVTRERDAAVRDLALHDCCDSCKHSPFGYEKEICMGCSSVDSAWDWRGVCAENTEGEAK